LTGKGNGPLVKPFVHNYGKDSWAPHGLVADQQSMTSHNRPVKSPVKDYFSMAGQSLNGLDMADLTHLVADQRLMMVKSDRSSSNQ